MNIISKRNKKMLKHILHENNNQNKLKINIMCINNCIQINSELNKLKKEIQINIEVNQLKEDYINDIIIPVPKLMQLHSYIIKTIGWIHIPRHSITASTDGKKYPIIIRNVRKECIDGFF